MENILEIRGLSRGFEQFQLKDINLEIPKGCIMGLVGENGAGKSTLIKLILNLIHRDAGTIQIFGMDNIQQERQIKEQIGVVFDECHFSPTLRAKDVDSIMKHIYQNWDSACFRQYLSRFRLPEKQSIKTYSRGMTMKLSIAVALSHQAKFLVLDEATSGLDPIVRDEILDLFFEFIQEEDRGVLISSHITSDLEKIADYITFLHEGKIFFCEPKDRLLDDYGVLKCTAEEFNAMDKGIVLGHRANRFGVEALIRRKDAKAGQMMDPAGIEDVMLFLVKGESE
ncbi:MAG: ABC transporter ATP-binding protein [Clostridiales bacterium]|jgi:ABC-2 type transport system ATP-binding protein|nr:ABC transporter ATP-binding protein [Clostridiales bacterium]